MNDWNDIATALEKLAEKMGGETVKDARLNDIKRIHVAINNISEKYAPCECESGSGSGSGGNANVVTIPFEWTSDGSYYYPIPSITYPELAEVIDTLGENDIIKLVCSSDDESATIMEGIICTYYMCAISDNEDNEYCTLVVTTSNANEPSLTYSLYCDPFDGWMARASINGAVRQYPAQVLGG